MSKRNVVEESVSAHVVVVGSLNMDLVVQAPRLPTLGETILGHGFRTVPGGKGANQAVAAARLGATVSMIGRVGKDAYGQTLLDNLASAGVDQTAVYQDPTHATGIAIIVVDAQGQNSIVVASGSNMQLNVDDVLQAADQIAAADILLLQLETPLETALTAAEIANRNNIPVLLNPAPAQHLPEALLSAVDILVPNETEAALLTDLPVQTEEEAISAAMMLSQLISGDVILTLGERGAISAVNGRSLNIPAFEVQSIDTTAAGDAFVAGLAVALAEGQSISQAIRWGNAAGALTTTVLGAQSSLPFRNNIEQIIASTQSRIPNQ